MTEAVERISQFAFEEFGARRVEIRCDEENHKSRLLAERVNFELEGTFKTRFVSQWMVIVYETHASMRKLNRKTSA